MSIDYEDQFSNVVLSMWESDDCCPGNFLSNSITNSTTMCYKCRTQRSARRALLSILTTNLATMCHQLDSEECSAGTSIECLLLIQQRCAISLGVRGLLCGNVLVLFTINSATLCYQFGSQRSARRARSIVFYNSFSNVVSSVWESGDCSAATFDRLLQLIQQHYVISLRV